MNRIVFAVGVTLATFIALHPIPASAELLLDQGMQVEGLWLFPSQEQPKRFQYLPERAFVSRNERDEPQFSLTFFVHEQPTEIDPVNAANTIVAASGGAIMHVLVEYGTRAETVQAAEQKLKRILNDDDVEITGPILFDAATMSVISSVLTGDDTRSATLVAQRPAPVLEGQRVAMSFELKPTDASVLLATLQTETPDFSVAFELGFRGLTDSYDAAMVIDWQKTKNSMQAAAGAKIYVVSLEAEAIIEKAFQDGAIRLDVNGDDVAMERLVELAYEKAMDIMYAPIEIDQVPEDQRGGAADALGMMFSGIGGSGADSPVGIGVSASYRMKDLRSEGETTLSFAKRSSVTRNALLTMNLGGIYKEIANDPRFIRIVSTADCDFSQRQVYVLIDGALKPEIGSFVNHATVTIRKQHMSGRSTFRELLVNTQNAGADGMHGPLTYNSNGDPCNERWLNYEYRTAWDFVGGGKYKSDWEETEAASVSLSAPYHRQTVEVAGDVDKLAEQGVKAIVVEVVTPFFGDVRTQRRSIRPGTNQGPIEPITVVLPEGQYFYQYKITWVLEDNDRRQISGIDDLGYLFVDEMPEA